MIRIEIAFSFKIKLKLFVLKKIYRDLRRNQTKLKMALASTADNFGQFTNDPNENVKKAAAATTAASSSTSTNQLNFYESMYHFRKMFPNVDSDVIECVLRSNSGAITPNPPRMLICRTRPFEVDCSNCL